MAKAPTGDDPFFDYRNNILKNVPGYTDQAKLDKFERFTTAAAAVELELNPVRGSFDRAHLQQIHKRLFEEVYPWAGEPRPTDLRRPGFSWFVRKEFLSNYARQHIVGTRSGEALERFERRDIFRESGSFFGRPESHTFF